MSDLYNNLDAPIPVADWSKEYGLSKSIMALWDLTASEPQHGGCIVKYDDSTNQATLADGIAHKVNSRRSLNPENWVFRPHYPVAQNAADGTWDVRLVAEHENNSDSRDNHGTMIVNQKNKKGWGWLNDIAWVRKLNTPAGDDELKFNDKGFLPALAGGKGAPDRWAVATPVCRNGGFVSDGANDGQWAQAGKFIIGPAVVEPPTPTARPGTTTGPGGSGGAGNTVTSQVGNVGGGYNNTGIPNLNSGGNGIGATYQGGGYGGLANPNLTYGANPNVNLTGGGYGGLANPGRVEGYSTGVGQESNQNGPINQGGGYGGTSNPGSVAGYSEAVGGNRGASNPGDSSGQSSPFGDNGGNGGNGGGYAASGGQGGGGGYDGSAGGAAGAAGDTGATGEAGAAGDNGQAGDAGPAGNAGDNFNGAETGNNTVVDDGPGQTQTDPNRKGNPGQTQTDPKIKLAVEWGMRADCGIDFGNHVIGRLVHEPMSATEGSGEPRLVKLFCDTKASPDDKLDTEEDGSSNHKRMPKLVQKKAIHGWVRVKESSPSSSHYDYSYHGTPPNKENKSGSSGGSGGTPTGGGGVPGTTGTDPARRSPGDMTRGGGVPGPSGGSSSPTGGGSPGPSSPGTGATTSTETKEDSQGNTWTREVTRDNTTGNIIGLPGSWTR